jgi:hypothetical protein
MKIKKFIAKTFGGHYKEGEWDYYVVGKIPMMIDVYIYKINKWFKILWCDIQIKYYKTRYKIK